MGICLFSYLAVVSALAAEADYVFAPEWPPENWQEEMCHKLELVNYFFF